MKGVLVLLSALVFFTTQAWSVENVTIKGSIGVDFLWDTTAGLQTYDEPAETFSEIPQGENVPYRYFSHSDKQTSIFHTVVQNLNEEEVVTFIEL